MGIKMKKTLKYILIFIIGFLFALLYFKKDTKKMESEQVQVMLHEIKNARKLIVAETDVSEIYNYQTAVNYFYIPYNFSKKAIVVANAKVKVAYDLSKMEVKIDSVNHKIIIKKIPKEEIIITPNLKYYDLEQSVFNTFSKDELNKINQNAVDKLKETIDVSDLKKQAKEKLLQELQNVYYITKVLGWEIVDESEQKIFLNNFKD